MPGRMEGWSKEIEKLEKKIADWQKRIDKGMKERRYEDGREKRKPTEGK